MVLISTLDVNQDEPYVGNAHLVRKQISGDNKRPEKQLYWLEGRFESMVLPYKTLEGLHRKKSQRFSRVNEEFYTGLFIPDGTNEVAYLRAVSSVWRRH